MGNRQGHVVIGVADDAAIDRAQMHREGIIGGWRTGSRADLIDVSRPGNGEGLRTPHLLKERPIGALRNHEHRTREVGKAVLYWIGGRSFGLLGVTVA